VQQPSDLTYRLFDWGRKSELGKSRELHIHKALESIDYDIIEIRISNLYDSNFQPQQVDVIFQSAYFTTSYLCLRGKQRYACQFNGFAALTIISGAVLICSQEDEELLAKGDTLIVSEICQVTLKALENAEIIITKSLNVTE
jgi:mannose-6-phosphate isomerase